MSGDRAAEPLKVLTVCGVGMGSSLMLRMNAEEVFKDLGIDAKVEATDVSSARSMSADMLLGQGMHTEEFEASSIPMVVSVSNFMDKDALKRQVSDALKDAGWLK